MQSQATNDPASGGEEIACGVSDAFAAWIRDAGGSLVLTTYQAGKVAVIGWDDQRSQVTLLLRQFDKPMGLAAHPAGGRLALATRHAVIVLANAPLLAHAYLEDQPGKYDALYLPRTAHHTGDLNVHDLAYDVAGALWLVNTRFCCLAHPSDASNFVPAWKPPFVSQIVPEDRCHLNGLAMVDGRPRYVTCLGETDVVGGWRANKAAGGVIVDIPSNEIVLRGLSMPHSPRWYQDQLWVLNSGAGELCAVDVKTGRHNVVCALPGYLRELSFAGPFALVGLCQIRERHIFGGLPVQQRHAKLLCGVAVVDLRSGREVGMFEFTSGVQELYEVLFLPGVRRPMILNTDKDAARETFTAPEFSYWLRPSSEISAPPPAPQ
jgi:uncharacterized protein (TIGR03032 family)